MAGAVRKDMSKVIVERPRVKPRPERPGRTPKDLEKLPSRAGIKRTHWGKPFATKELNENLAPLYRFLQGQVGRPWDQVFSELNANIKRGNAVQEHVLSHLDHIIARRVAIVPASNRFPCGLAQAHAGGRASLAPGELYVDPRDGIIKLSRRRFFDHATPRELTALRINEGEMAVKVDGLWYGVKVRAAVFAPEGHLEDVLLGTVAAADARRLRERYGADVYGLARRQLSSRELRNLGLANDAA